MYLKGIVFYFFSHIFLLFCMSWTTKNTDPKMLLFAVLLLDTYSLNSYNVTRMFHNLSRRPTMKKCTACGATFDDTSKFCPYCGTEYGAEECPAGDSEKPGCQPKKLEKIKEHRINTYGMIWHRIVLFFVGIKAARSLLSGAAILRNYVDLDVSGFLVAVRNLFLGIGVVRIAIGVFALICLYRLGKYMRSGPGSVKILYGMSIASALIFSTWLTSILPNADTTSMGLYDTLLFDIVMIIVNSVYYGRRKDVFIN